MEFRFTDTAAGCHSQENELKSNDQRFSIAWIADLLLFGAEGFAAAVMAVARFAAAAGVVAVEIAVAVEPVVVVAAGPRTEGTKLTLQLLVTLDQI